MEADSLLVMRARRGDAAAFGQLVHLHYAGVYRAACAVLGSTLDAEDVAQDAWLHAYVHLAQFQETATFKTWVHAIVRNRAIDHHRRARRRRWEGGAHAAALPPPDDVPSHARTPEDLVLDAEREARLATAISRLPHRLRATLELWHSGDYSYADLARIAGVRTSTIKSRIWQARRHVAQACGDVPHAP